MTREKLLKAAYAIQPHLTKLLGAESDKIAQKLGELLKQAENGQNVNIQLIDLFSENEKIREWIHNFIESESDTTRGFSPLLGERTEPLLDVKEYYCVNCGHRWFQRKASQTVPKCKECGEELIPYDNS